MKYLQVLIKFGWYGMSISLLPIISIFNITLMIQFVELYFFLGLVVAFLKGKDRILNGAIYCVISMLVSILAFHIYNFEGFYSTSGIFIFLSVGALLALWRIRVLSYRYP
jgi:hypothetical protein